MNQAKDLDDFVRTQLIDNEVTRVADAACRFDTPTTKPDRVGENTSQAGNLD